MTPLLPPPHLQLELIFHGANPSFFGSCFVWILRNLLSCRFQHQKRSHAGQIPLRLKSSCFQDSLLMARLDNWMTKQTLVCWNETFALFSLKNMRYFWRSVVIKVLCSGRCSASPIWRDNERTWKAKTLHQTVCILCRQTLISRNLL